jgi:hypothetical protein
MPEHSNARVAAASAMRSARERDPDISWGALAEIAFEYAPGWVYQCPDCGAVGTHASTCSMFPGERVEHGNRVAYPRNQAQGDAQ